MPRFDISCAKGHLSLDVVAAWNDYNTACPTCGEPTERVWLKPPAAHGDDIPGGLVVENLGHEPVTVYSHSERRRIAKERGLVERVQHVGVPGSDRSPHTTRWF